MSERAQIWIRRRPKCERICPWNGGPKLRKLELLCLALLCTTSRTKKNSVSVLSKGSRSTKTDRSTVSKSPLQMVVALPPCSSAVLVASELEFIRQCDEASTPKSALEKPGIAIINAHNATNTASARHSDLLCRRLKSVLVEGFISISDR